MADRFMVSFGCGVFAYMTALDLGLPAWRHLPVGDAADFGFTTAIIAWYLLKELRRA